MALIEEYMDVKPHINCLRYNVENCLKAFEKLEEINEKLLKAMESSSGVNPNDLGDYNRIIQDYLIIRVAGLFDKDGRTISFYNLLDDIEEIKKIKQEEIIRYIIEKRDRFCAHSDRDYIGDMDNAFPNTHKIISSNLKDLLNKLQNILKIAEHKLTNL